MRIVNELISEMNLKKEFFILKFQINSKAIKLTIFIFLFLTL